MRENLNASQVSPPNQGLRSDESPCSDSEKGITKSVLALFPSIARINHSCRPNCHHYHSGKTGEFVVRAVEEVSEGEELTISYMSPLQRADFHDRESRRKILQGGPSGRGQPFVDIEIRVWLKYKKLILWWNF